MKITNLHVKDFRNIEEAELSFTDGVNVLYGENAQGKTNLIEAMGLFSQGRSFRGAKEKEMIRFGAPFTSLRVEYRTQKREEVQGAELTFSKTKRICRHNGAPLAKLSELVGKLTTVIFCPKHLLLVSEGPALRRSFLDVAMLPFASCYLDLLRQYRRVLDERNALLKQSYHPFEGYDVMLDTLTEQLICLGVKIAGQREKYLLRLTAYAKDILYDLSSQREELSLQYAGLLKEEEYRAAAKRLQEQEKLRATTLFGAHRDDFEILLNGKEARLYASQGQQRSIALAIKLAEGEMIRAYLSEYPVFLLDDIFSELDEGRKQYIMKGLQGRQVILTTCDDAVCRLWKDANVYEVKNGHFQKIEVKKKEA